MKLLTTWADLHEIERVARCRSLGMGARLLCGRHADALVRALPRRRLQPSTARRPMYDRRPQETRARPRDRAAIRAGRAPVPRLQPGLRQLVVGEPLVPGVRRSDQWASPMIDELLQDIRDLVAAIDRCDDGAQVIRLTLILRARQAQLADLRGHGR